LTCEGGLDSEPEAEVVFFVRDEERARVRIAAGQGQRRWAFEIDLAAVSLDDVLRVEAHAAGCARILSMGTLRPYR
jgi:hypothetical protein